MIEWRIKVYNTSGAQVAILDMDSESGCTAFAFDRVVNDVGAFAMVYSPENTKVSLFGLDYFAVFQWRDEEMSIDWRTEYVGQMRIKHHDYTAANGEKITIKGFDLNYMLERTINDAAAGSTGATKDGVAETVAKAFVSEQMGATAGARARFSFTIEADGANGSTVHVTEPGGNLLDICQFVAKTGGGDFSVELGTPPAMEFQWHDGQLGTDRSATVQFSIERGNLDELSWDEWGGGVNAVLVAGQGEGSSRQRTWYTASRMTDSPWNRIEQFRDARDTSDTDVHADRAALDLEAGRPKRNLKFKIVQQPGCLYGLHYDFGDLVSVLVGGIDATGQVSTVKVDVDENGTTITPEVTESA